MKQYLENTKYILEHGEKREERTGTGTLSAFSPPEMRFDLTKGFPLLTTKRLHIPSIVHELIWFLKGDTNIKYLAQNNIKIWNADAYRHYKSEGGELTFEEFVETLPKNGYDLGPIYPTQWRDLVATSDDLETIKAIDQVYQIINSIEENPTSRRHIVTAWNPGQLDEMVLPPCHILFQAYVSNDGGLSLKMYQRSADWFLGKPFNIASYALLTHMIAQVTGLYAKELIMTDGDAHIYLNHVEQMKEQLAREPRELPTLKLNPNIKDINDFTAEDISFENYNPHPLIKGNVSVGK